MHKTILPISHTFMKLKITSIGKDMKILELIHIGI